MEAGYKPDGWLGLVQGMDLYYAFSSDEEFEKNMPTLLKLMDDNSSVADMVDGKLNFAVSNLYVLICWDIRMIYHDNTSCVIAHKRCR